MSVASQRVEQPVLVEKRERPPSAIEARLVQRLPQFITLFFSFTMVGFFRTFTDTFHFTTAPAIDWRDGSQDLILISFLVTLFWIVTAWLGYSVLVERHPYTMDLGRFLFDVARFSLLNFQMNFAFLAGRIASFQVYIFSIALWHAMMAGWYLWRLEHSFVEGGRLEARRDAASHGLRCATYVALGLIYTFAVALRAGQPGADVLRYLIAGVTFAMIVLWNIQRIRDLTGRVALAS